MYLILRDNVGLLFLSPTQALFFHYFSEKLKTQKDQSVRANIPEWSVGEYGSLM